MGTDAMSRGRMYELFLGVLRRHDSRCLDTEEEREVVAEALMEAMSAAEADEARRRGVIEWEWWALRDT